MKQLSLSLVLTLVLVLSLAVPVFAVTTEDIAVTYTPAWMSVTTTPTAWEINNVGGGDGKIRSNTIYYTNPTASVGDTTAPSATVLATECLFATTNDSNIAIDVFLNMTDFTGGSDPMLNSELGTNEVGTYGAYGWYADMTYTDKVIIKKADSLVLIDGQAEGTAFDWGLELQTQSDAWTGKTESTGTLTISIIEDAA